MQLILIAIVIFFSIVSGISALIQATITDKLEFSHPLIGLINSISIEVMRKLLNLFNA